MQKYVKSRTRKQPSKEEREKREKQVTERNIEKLALKWGTTVLEARQMLRDCKKFPNIYGATEMLTKDVASVIFDHFRRTDEGIKAGEIKEASKVKRHRIKSNGPILKILDVYCDLTVMEGGRKRGGGSLFFLSDDLSE